MNSVITKMDASGGTNNGEVRQISIVLEGVEPEWSSEQYIPEYG